VGHDDRRSSCGRKIFRAGDRRQWKIANRVLNLAKIRINQKNFANALELLQNCISLDPMNVEALALYPAHTCIYGNFNEHWPVRARSM